MELRKRFLHYYWTIYFSNFIPHCFFRKESYEVIEEFEAESDEIMNLSSLVEIHKRLEKIEVLKIEHIMEETKIDQNLAITRYN